MLFLAIPLGVSFYISLCEYPLLQQPLFIGASNYSRLAVDPVFHKVLYNTLLFSVAFIPLSTAFAIGLAILVNQRCAGRRSFARASSRRRLCRWSRRRWSGCAC